MGNAFRRKLQIGITMQTFRGVPNFLRGQIKQTKQNDSLSNIFQYILML